MGGDEEGVGGGEGDGGSTDRKAVNSLHSLCLSSPFGLGSRFIVILSISNHSLLEEGLVGKRIGLHLVLTFANHAGFL